MVGKLTAQSKILLSYVGELIDDRFRILAQHLNTNTDAINIQGEKLNGIKAKAIIGWQCKKKSWPENCWSNVVLFHNGEIQFPAFSPPEEWEFRNVYVDV